MKRHYKITVQGKVQGVFYRASAREQAMFLGLNGFVKNEKNGSVYMEVEGEENMLDQFVAWCNEGPRGARVDQLAMEEGVVNSFSTFEIRKD